MHSINTINSIPDITTASTMSGTDIMTGTATAHTMDAADMIPSITTANDISAADMATDIPTADMGTGNMTAEKICEIEEIRIFNNDGSEIEPIIQKIKIVSPIDDIKNANA